MNLARRIAEFLVVGICTLAFLLTTAGICASLLKSGAAGTRDFVTYWAAGQQLVHYANPYDRNATRRTSTSLTLLADGALTMKD